MAMAAPTTQERDREHPRAVEARVRSHAITPTDTDRTVETGIPPETRMLGFVMIYMLAVSLGVGALLVRVW